MSQIFPSKSAFSLSPIPGLNPIFLKIRSRSLPSDSIIQNQLIDLFTHDSSENGAMLTAGELRERKIAERQSALANSVNLELINSLNSHSLSSNASLFRSLTTVRPSGKFSTVSQKQLPLSHASHQSLFSGKVDLNTIEEEKEEEEEVDVENNENNFEERILTPRIYINPLRERPFVALYELYAGDGEPDVSVGTESVNVEPIVQNGDRLGRHEVGVQASFRVKKEKIFTWNKFPSVHNNIYEELEGEGNDGLGMRGEDSVFDLKEIFSKTEKKYYRRRLKSTKSGKVGDDAFKLKEHKNASIMVHPRGYKELNLSLPLKKLVEERGIQVTEWEIERTLAASHGIALKEGNIQWPSIREFTVKLALLKIKLYIQMLWTLDASWNYEVFFIHCHTTNYRKKYIFQVIFSMPTKEHPVPIATASVFFIFETEHYSCCENTVKVEFLLEGTRYPFIPGTIEFRQEWLFNIVKNKTKILKAMSK